MNVQRAFVLLFALFMLALPAQAAELSFKAPHAAADSSFLLPVLFVPSAGENLNAVEGSINVPAGVSVESIDTSGSGFTLFASGPTYAAASRSISFLAGVPGGLSGTAPVILFVIHARAATPGTYVFTPNGVASYKNDGEGTKVAVSASAGSVVVGERGSVQPVDATSTAVPVASTPLVAEVGRDASLYEGKWFVTFYGGASGSSVDHYEVKEGWWGAPVRGDRVVVLNDQSLSSSIQVTAVSQNGRSVVRNIPAAHPWKGRIIIALIVLGVLALCILSAWFIRRKR